MVYNIVFISAIYQHDPAIGIRIFSPSRPSLPPLTPYHPSRLSFAPWVTLEISTNCLVSHMVMVVKGLLSQFFPPSPSAPITTSLFLVSYWLIKKKKKRNGWGFLFFSATPPMSCWWRVLTLSRELKVSLVSFWLGSGLCPESP